MTSATHHDDMSPDRSEPPSDGPDLRNLAELHARPGVPEQSGEEKVSTLEQLFYRDDFARTVMIGFAGGFGLSTLVILIALELTSLRAIISDSLGALWVFVPIATAVGFVAWSFMLIRIRRHRHGKWLRKQAFEKRDEHAGGPGSDEEDELEDEPPVDRSQEDWL